MPPPGWCNFCVCSGFNTRVESEGGINVISFVQDHWVIRSFVSLFTDLYFALPTKVGSGQIWNTADKVFKKFTSSDSGWNAFV